MSRAQAARRLDVPAGTLARWERAGLVPLDDDGRWSQGSLNHARVVRGLRSRGRSLAEITRLAADGGLALGYLDTFLPTLTDGWTLEDAAGHVGLEPALVQRLLDALGASGEELLADDDVEMLRAAASALDSGFPLVALLQLVRVYGQAGRRLAEAEVRLFRLYVRDPQVAEGASVLEAADDVKGVGRQLLGLARPLLHHAHDRWLRWSIEQDAVSQVERSLQPEALGGLDRARVAIAFADLAGYTRLTEERGDEEALDVVERFVARVEATLPPRAHVVKTIGDEVMVVGEDPAELLSWAVAQAGGALDEPSSRIGVHVGEVVHRDGDYFGREVNRAARVVARAGGGEVIATAEAMTHGGDDLVGVPIGAVRLKGFAEATELVRVVAGGDGGASRRGRRSTGR